MKSQSRVTSPSASPPDAGGQALADGGRQGRYGNSFLQDQLASGVSGGAGGGTSAGGGGPGGGGTVAMDDDGARTTAGMASARSTGPLGSPQRADVEAADAFVASGPKGPTAIQPATGLGGFDAAYTPGTGAGTLDITVRGGVHFIDPLHADGAGRAVASDPKYAKMATSVNRLPTDQRTAILPQFAWATAADERQDWIDQLKKSVQNTWSNQHAFHIHRPGWTWVGAQVAVHVNVAARTERNADDHVAIDAVKTPESEDLYSYGISSSVSSMDAADPHDSTMQISSSDVAARPADILEIQNVYFATGSATLDAAGQEQVRKWARTFAGDPSNPASHAVKALIQGHTDSVGGTALNQELSERRLKHVVDLVRAAGFTNIDDRLTQEAKGKSQMVEHGQDNEASKWSRRVMLSIDHPEGAQVLAAHEFGHVFGLGDQYATSDKAGNPTSVSGTGAQTGQAADHDGLTRNMLDENGTALSGSIYENNDGIMSGGNKVNAEHYSTFDAALRSLTSVSEWALGGPQARPDPATLDTPPAVANRAP